MSDSVIIIEDDDEIRDALREVLEHEGFPVTTYRNGKEALEGLPKVARPGLILLDLMMPIMDGWQFMRCRTQLPDSHASVPVVLVSAVADYKKALETGAAGFLRKPVDLDVLLQTVKHHYGT